MDVVIPWKLDLNEFHFLSNSPELKEQMVAEEVGKSYIESEKWLHVKWKQPNEISWCYYQLHITPNS